MLNYIFNNYTKKCVINLISVKYNVKKISNFCLTVSKSPRKNIFDSKDYSQDEDLVPFWN